MHILCLQKENISIEFQTLEDSQQQFLFLLFNKNFVSFIIQMDRLTNLNNFFHFYRGNRCPAVAELISSEEEYINRLKKVVCGYMLEYYNENSEIPLPDALKEYNGLVIFSNIAEIYEWHRHYFLKALKENQHSVRGLSKIFTENKRHFHMYSKFCLNKSISEYVISTNISYFNKIKEKLKHKNTIEDLIIAPVQRVGRYKLLLQEYLKYLDGNGSGEDIKYLNEACDVVKEVCNEVDEYMALNGIKNFDGLLSVQGKLLVHGRLTCTYDCKRSNLYVFLFKCLILFTEEQERKGKYTNATYNSRMQIPMNKLEFKELPSCKFSLQLKDPNAASCTVICQAATKAEHNKFLNAIKQQIALQKNLINDLVNPKADQEEREVL